ncbi:MAG: hypothetical protein WC460_05225 [Patescibacteria group bacterium]
MKNFVKLIALFTLLLSLSLVINSVLSVRPVAAQVPFAGPGTIIGLCTNTASFLIAVGPPVPGLYMIRQLPRGIWLAGLFVPTPIPCFFGNVPHGVAFPVILFGSG